MLEWVKDIVRPVRTEDPRFGSLLFSRAAGFWEGRSSFRPVNGPVDVLVFGSADGPTEVQRTCFAALEDRYEAILPAIEERLTTEANRVPAARGRAFRLVAIDIPEQAGGVTKWALSFETDPPSWHFTVLMRGWSAHQVVAEC